MIVKWNGSIQPYSMGYIKVISPEGTADQYLDRNGDIVLEPAYMQYSTAQEAAKKGGYTLQKG